MGASLGELAQYINTFLPHWISRYRLLWQQWFRPKTTFLDVIIYVPACSLLAFSSKVFFFFFQSCKSAPQMISTEAFVRTNRIRRSLKNKNNQLFLCFLTYLNSRMGEIKINCSEIRDGEGISFRCQSFISRLIVELLYLSLLLSSTV